VVIEKPTANTIPFLVSFKVARYCYGRWPILIPTVEGLFSLILSLIIFSKFQVYYLFQNPK